MDKIPDIIDVKVLENSLIFSDQILADLNAQPNDRLLICYESQDEKLIPVVRKDETGNKLSRENRISFRGTQRKLLLEFGSSFYKDQIKDGVVYLKANGLPVFTTVEKAIKTYLTKQIILDTNYNITKLSNYEF